MSNKFTNTLLYIRATLNRFLMPRKFHPVSTKFGIDRGTPIDRYWIESFLKENNRFIKGKCLEIGDNRYTKQFGGKRVTKSDILDIDPKNKRASIIADLKDAKDVKDNTYDCIILTHVLGLIDEYKKALYEVRRILRPGGVLLLTTSCFSPTYAGGRKNYWRFTPDGAKYLFEKIFGEKKVEVKSYGNVISGQLFWVGLSQEELTKEELEFNDPNFPCVVGVIARK